MLVVEHRIEKLYCRYCRRNISSLDQIDRDLQACKTCVEEIKSQGMSVNEYETIQFLVRKYPDFDEYRFEEYPIIWLDLSKLGLSEVPKEVYQLNKLESLILSENDLITLPKCLLNLEHFDTLGIGDSPLKILDWYGQLKITTLYLDGTVLRRYPKVLCDLKYLEKLDLRNSRYVTSKFFPKSFSKLTSLKYLNLRNNKINFLPKSVCALPNLVTLDISRNPRIRLPKDVGNIKHIKNIKFEHNHYQVLPVWLRSMVDLEKIDCSFNEFSSLPVWLAELTKLKVLSVACTKKLKEVEVLSQLNLNNLDISGCKLTEFPKIRPPLRMLNIRFNKITKLPDWLPEVQSLEGIDIYWNDIQSLDILKEMKNLRYLAVEKEKRDLLPEEITMKVEQGQIELKTGHSNIASWYI